MTAGVQLVSVGPLSLHHVGPRNWTRVIRRGSKGLCHWSKPRALHKLGDLSTTSEPSPHRSLSFQ